MANPTSGASAIWNSLPEKSFGPLAPLIWSDSANEFEFVLPKWLEDCGFSFTYIHEIFAAYIYQVGFMADDHRVFPEHVP
jgi:hypothetical protein